MPASDDDDELPLLPPTLDETATCTNLDDHRKSISNAVQLPAGPERDAALLSALRSISTELAAAEEYHARSAKRVAMTKQLFDWAAGELSGYSKDDYSVAKHELSRGKKAVVDVTIPRGDENTNTSGNCADEKCHGVFGDNDDYHQYKLPSTGPIPPILLAISGGGLSPDQVIAHRNAFYRKLCNVSPAELSSYTPPQSLVNMKSRSQLDQYIFIASHWETGTESMDVMAFRRQNKTFYTKMKFSKENLGRRTGHHVRDIARSAITNNGDENTPSEIGRRKAFCQHGKNDESLMYLCVEELYDAIFDIHCMANTAGDGHHHHHRPALICKKICNMRYANVPQEQIKVFVDTCPICSSSRRTPQSSSSASPTTTLKRPRIVYLEE